MPKHIAIICDGNRRWARKHGWKVFKGHKYAVDKVFEPLIDKAIELGISHLTFWIFSTENWQRDKKEVKFLMDLFRHYFDKKVDTLNEKGVRVNMIGDITSFEKDIQERIKKGMKDTKDNKKITVTLAMSYGGRDEVVRAAKKIISENIELDKLDENKFSSFLDTADMPDPDMIIRTGGDYRMSGFLLWQSQYSEFFFPKFMFPDFTPDRLEELVGEFHKRKRRFGK